MKHGDFLIHPWVTNDGGDLGGAKPRGSLKGIGEETQDVPQTVGPAFTHSGFTTHGAGTCARCSPQPSPKSRQY